jgi:hypothetical protein
MEQYTKYLKKKRVIIGLVIVALIILNSLFGGKCTDGDDHSCEKETATMMHICSGVCNHGLGG